MEDYYTNGPVISSEDQHRFTMCEYADVADDKSLIRMANLLNYEWHYFKHNPTTLDIDVDEQAELVHCREKIVFFIKDHICNNDLVDLIGLVR